MSVLLKLSRPALISLAAAIETGRLSAPYARSPIDRYVPKQLRHAIVAELDRLSAMGATPAHLAYTLNLLAAERESTQQVRDRVELVWTGQEVVGSESRDTAVVVRELFTTAQRSVLIASYAIDRGEKARALFQGLSDRMDNHPALQVRMFLNVPRSHGSDESESTLLRKFATLFRQEVWPGNRLPEVFYDPRSLQKPLNTGTYTKACLHAKCVVVDDERVLITSANFTQAAHDRNIEAGVLLSDSAVARAVRSQFESLVTRAILRRIPGL